MYGGGSTDSDAEVYVLPVLVDVEGGDGEVWVLLHDAVFGVECEAAFVDEE